MRNKIGAFGIFAGTLLLAGVVFAQESTITFPIPELGNCTSKEQCKTYCDDPANHEPCISLAESHGIMSAEEVKIARTIGTQKGRGGCVGLQCKTYCDEEGNIDECLDFAQEHKLIPENEIA